MRRILFALVMTLAAGSAMASSIEFIQGTQIAADSVVAIDCSNCRSPDAIPPAPSGYIVPTLPAGNVQSSEIREVNGKREVLRTENWLGGSPVVFVTRAPATMQAFLPSIPGADGIDRTAMTSAVSPEPAASTEQTAPADISVWQLRQ